MQSVAPEASLPHLAFPDVREVGEAFREDLATIAVRNDLAKATLGLSVIEQRLFFLALASIRKGDTGPVPLKIPQSTYARVFHPGKNHHGFAKVLATAAKELTSSEAVVIQDGEELKLPLVAGAWYTPAASSADGQPYVLLQIHAALTPYLFNLTGGFTKLPLKALIGMDCKYTLPLLLLLRARNAGRDSFTDTMPLADLRSALDISGYRWRSDLHKRVLEPARKELRARNVTLRIEHHGSGQNSRLEFRAYFSSLADYNPAEGPKERAERLAGSLQFVGSLGAYAEEHGWDKVAEVVERVHGHVTTRPSEKRIPNPGGYLRRSLQQLDAKATPQSPDEAVATAPKPDDNPRALAAVRPVVYSNESVYTLQHRLVTDFVAARDAYLQAHFESLDPARQEQLRAVAKESFDTALTKGHDPHLLIEARALDVLEEEDPTLYPPALSSVEGFVAAHRPLDNLEPDKMMEVIREARKSMGWS